MGQKVHPRSLRIGIIYGWRSKWFADKRSMPQLLREDEQIRTYLKKKLKDAAVDNVDIERTARAVTITIHTGKPGFVIGRGGTGVEELKKALRKIVGGNKKFNFNVNVVEVSRPSLSANIIIQSMIADLERRMPFRRVLKTHVDRVQKGGAKGVKLMVKGRLNGAEIARTEKILWGSVPLHNLRADIDYASEYAHTIFGSTGIKVWIYRGEVFSGAEGAEKDKLGQVVRRGRK